MDIGELAKAKKRVIDIFYNLQKIEETLFLHAIAFKFSDTNSFLELSVLIDTDELVWREVTELDEQFKVITNSNSILTDIVGYNLFWVRNMTNQQGYFDAVQMEFWQINGLDECVVQFKVVASRLYIDRLERGSEIEI